VATKKPDDKAQDKAPDTAKVEDTAEAEIPTEDTAAQGKDTAADGPTADQINDSMTEQEIRDAGLKIDLPYESPPGAPEPLQYANDIAPEKGWTPPEGFTIAGVPFADVVAGIGGGAMPQQPDEVAGGQSSETAEPG
jgi:hypothetical protein